MFNREVWRGERIREQMASGDPRWIEAVTPRTAEYILSIGGIERLRHSLAKD
ncbi:nicotinamide-nucleotide adenylyltransferase [compost metagenome]